MKTEIREMYRCEYCNKLYQRKHAAIYHEKICSKNPDNQRACIVDGVGCKNLIKRETINYYDNSYGSHYEVVELLYCKKLQHFIYPAKVEVKKNMYDLVDQVNEPMPKECKYYEGEQI